jgi:hypothetical protein
LNVEKAWDLKGRQQGYQLIRRGAAGHGCRVMDLSTEFRQAEK